MVIHTYNSYSKEVTASATHDHSLTSSAWSQMKLGHTFTIEPILVEAPPYLCEEAKSSNVKLDRATRVQRLAIHVQCSQGSADYYMWNDG